LLLFFKKEDLPCLALCSVYALTGNSVFTLNGSNGDKKKKGRLAMGDLISIGFGAVIFAFLLVYVTTASKI
jgi:hypothetical protein